MARNYADALCSNCGEPFHWLIGEPQVCPACSGGNISEETIIISGGSNFLKRGAIVPSKTLLRTIIQALIEERDRVVRLGGDHYEQMTIEELNREVEKLQNYLEKRGG